jgi:hypothetical protein
LNVIWLLALVLSVARLRSAAINGRFQRWLKGVTSVVGIGFSLWQTALSLAIAPSNLPWTR